MMLQALICPSGRDGIRTLNTNYTTNAERPLTAALHRSLYMSSHSLEMATGFCDFSLLRGTNRKFRLLSNLFSKG